MLRAWLSSLLDSRPGISPRAAQAAWLRVEMDRHPLEREESWPGLGEAHVPVGEPLKPGDLAKWPVFKRGS